MNSEASSVWSTWQFFCAPRACDQRVCRSGSSRAGSRWSWRTRAPGASRWRRRRPAPAPGCLGGGAALAVAHRELHVAVARGGERGVRDGARRVGGAVAVVVPRVGERVAVGVGRRRGVFTASGAKPAVGVAVAEVMTGGVLPSPPPAARRAVDLEVVEGRRLVRVVHAGRVEAELRPPSVGDRLAVVLPGRAVEGHLGLVAGAGLGHPQPDRRHVRGHVEVRAAG